MRKIEQYQTIDGKVHQSVKAAQIHLNRIIEDRLGAIVDKLRNKKPLEMHDILSANLCEFAALYDLSIDAEFTEDENDD